MYLWLLLVLLIPCAFCDDEFHIPVLREEQYPALLYVEHFSDRQQLNIAYWDDDRFAVHELFYGSRVAVHPVGDDVFYVSGADMRGLDHKYIVDIRKGTSNNIVDDRIFRYLGMIPSHSVLLMHHGLQDNFTAFYRYILHTQKLELVSQFRNGNKETGLNGIVSPDLKYMASCRYMGEQDDIHPKPAQYQFSITNIKTKETTWIDDEVGIVISPVSSFSKGYPPFVWLSDNELMYLDMDMKKNTYWASEKDFVKDTSSTLKIAHVSDDGITITTHGDYDLPLTLSGGTFRTNGDRIFYEDRWEVDQTRKEIVERMEPFEIIEDKDTGQVTIHWHDNKLYPVKGNYWVHPLLSPSQNYLAYATKQRISDYDRRSSAYIKRYGTEEPFLLDDSAGRYTRFVAWIE